MDRKEVYGIIDTERDYQDSLWKGTASSEGLNLTSKNVFDRTLDEYCLYIYQYASELPKIATKGPVDEKLNFIRKVAGLCVAAMETHGGLPRNK